MVRIKIPVLSRRVSAGAGTASCLKSNKRRQEFTVGPVLLCASDGWYMLPSRRLRVKFITTTMITMMVTRKPSGVCWRKFYWDSGTLCVSRVESCLRREIGQLSARCRGVEWALDKTISHDSTKQASNYRRYQSKRRPAKVFGTWCKKAFTFLSTLTETVFRVGEDPK